MKPRTALQLQEALDAEFAWRQIEIHALREAAQGLVGQNKRTILRASVPILYAHWEGFVKESICLYVRYISSLGLRFGRVKQCFRGLAALEHVRTMETVRKKIFVSSILLAKIYSIEEETVRISIDSYIGRVGNLDFSLFEQLISFVGIDTNKYVPRKQLIDEKLLRSRNEIAHGEYLELDVDGLIELSKEVLLVIRWVKTDIENALVTQAYLASPLQ